MKLALAGIGKIARDQHIPTIAASDEWELAATISRHGKVEGVDAYEDFDAFLAERPDVPVVSLCMPPVPRFDYAAKALRAGRHVMLEKPPGATLAEVGELREMARARGLTLYASWHSRAARGVAPAREWLVGKEVVKAHINWKEDVRYWHPGQEWVFEAGGMGVFDPGINALSILTEILPMPVHLTAADLTVAENHQTPIAADLTFTHGVTATFDWRQAGEPTWDIEVETDAGRLTLRSGGARLEIDGKEMPGDPAAPGEYPALYAHMARLVAEGASDVDLAPMTHVADAMTLGRRILGPPFQF